MKKSTLQLPEQSLVFRRSYVIAGVSILLALCSFERWTLFNSVSADPIDGSWSIALNIIKQLNLRYGTDIVFTYGPLGYLGSTRLPIAIDRWQIFLYDLWLITQSTLVIWIILKNKFTVQTVAAILLVTTILYSGAGGDPPFLYFYFILFLLCHHLRTGNPAWLLNALGVTVFAFFVKGNVGLVCVGCFFLYLTYYAIRHKADWMWYLTFVMLTIALVLLGALLFHVDVYQYMLTTLQIIDSYNDVMRYYDDNGEQVLLVAFFVMGSYGLALLYSVWIYRNELNKKVIDDGVIVVMASLALFILFKEGFVRADRGHYSLFFKYAFLPLSLPAVFISKSILQRNMVLVALVVLAGQLVYAKPSFYFNHPKQLAHYISDIQDPVFSKPDSFQRFPAHWHDQLRRSTVDALPHNIASIYLNDLSHAYRPRPVFQSYQVTNRFLDSLNACFYQSSKAPEYIIYSHMATDNRYPFSDEIRTRLTLLRYYDLLDGDNEEQMLLKRRSKSYSLDTLSVREVNSRLQTEITVPNTTALQLMQVQVDYSLIGKAVRLLFQPPTLTLELETPDGKWHSYQASTTLLANGFLAKWIPDNESFKKLMRAKGQYGVPIRRVRVTTPRWAWALQPTIRVTQTQLSM